MQSNNPVFRRSEEFNQSSPYGQTSYPGYAPSPQGHGGEPGYAPPTAPPTHGSDDDRLCRPVDRDDARTRT